jgi:hypothetical protein
MYKRHYTPSIIKQHTGSGTEHRIYHFENGYGASVVPEYDGYDLATNRLVVTKGPCNLELAVVYWDNQDNYHLLDWNHPVVRDQLGLGDNPVRRLTSSMVDQLLDQIAAL